MSYAFEGHPVWGEIAPELAPHEFNQPWDMDVQALRRLSWIRRSSGVPFRIVSDARMPGIGADKSAHNERPCTAVDLRVLSSRERFLLIRAAIAEGCVRIGVYAPTTWQKLKFGKSSGSVHLDFSTDNPGDVMWMTW